MNASLSNFLNASRWIAAFLVVSSHVRHIVLVDFKDATDRALIWKGIYFVTGLGHEAVVIFFVISGFLVGGTTLDRWRELGPNLRAYASARTSRIYSVLVPALVIGFVLDHVGLHWFNSSQLYTASGQYQTASLSAVVASGLDASTFVANLLMLQGSSSVKTLGSNGPLWSLAYEWWYYVLFAMVAFAVTGAGRFRLWAVMAALILAALLPKALVLWSLVWLLGIIAHGWVKSRFWRPHPMFGFVIFMAVLTISRISHNQENLVAREPVWVSFARDFVLGAAYVVALVSATRLKSLQVSRVHHWLADFSYTTYLFHFPAMLFVVAVGFHAFGLRFQLQAGFSGFLYLVGLTSLLYLYCYAASLIVERHTGDLRRAIDRRLSTRTN